MKQHLFLLCLLLTCGFLLLSCKTGPAPRESAEDEPPAEEPIFTTVLSPEGEVLPVSSFGEIWAYVVAGRESALRPALPVSDVVYFGADISSYGALVDVPARKNLSGFSGRVHLVIKCDGRALTHFTLMPGRAERAALVAGLLSASEDYDGLQVDFENVPPIDGEEFLSFLSELRAGLGNKMFTVALPARARKIENDVYDYEKIAPLVDRIIVMAYDEHWSTSEPGPVASLPWCERVAAYAERVIGREKLVMGLPFYGRGWGSPNHSQAYVYSGIERIINENGVTDIHRENGIPTFNYNAPISVTVYYDDAYSLSARMELYHSLGVGSIGFWRLGQETPDVWSLLKLES